MNGASAVEIVPHEGCEAVDAILGREPRDLELASLADGLAAAPLLRGHQRFCATRSR